MGEARPHQWLLHQSVGCFSVLGRLVSSFRNQLAPSAVMPLGAQASPGPTRAAQTAGGSPSNGRLPV